MLVVMMKQHHFLLAPRLRLRRPMRANHQTSATGCWQSPMSRFLGLLIGVILALPAAAQDVVLVGGTVVDGTGTDGFQASLRIRDSRIVEIGTFEPGPEDRVFDVSGLVVSPGFVDIHNHSANGLEEEPAATSQVAQGITTMALGPDGSSALQIGEFLDVIESAKPAVNILTFIGHGTVRRQVLGDDYQRQSSDQEINDMEDLIDQAMQDGAYGLSSGLEYNPGFYSNTGEVIRLAAVAATYGGIYMSHIRDESYEVLEAIREAIEVGRRAQLPVQISHIKLGTVGVWGRTDEVFEVIDEARTEGIDVLADAYPYNAWSSGLGVLVPSRKFDDPDEVQKGIDDVGGPGTVLITRADAHPEYNFRTLEEIAEDREMSAVELYMEIMQEGGAGIVCASMTDEDVAAFLAYPNVMVSSDGGILARHPRGAGTFPRVLAKYVRDEGIMSLPDAIRKMAAMPAARLGLDDRGVLTEGAWADVIVFDPETVTDRSTFQDPFTLAEGVRYVFVNGTLIWDDGEMTEARPGLVMRNQ